ncbi:hypothetical protein [Oharaeibacter diazotrophicus]|uniref:Uncharacterized protein n=1 Tax=Oharaeibacter diazotrophicus TaxID=1920512 RepID=A0A4R6RFG8_9HYPH|nr:hypothetical protein [Oharaeibacter diazotrophicus]TDP85131.1 hypothetical protein EDD54_1978 [Oharaeibacter diazotrophicus]BBE74101.1 hypothetical protein OHA_1_03728 [Pleomorphomonas sp. SM30]GLS76211.1 hypothetical protein GCM10007904_15460 [Oharaeibacter diazotrophicus]
MADYYPVLKRAISSLPSSSGEARRAVYEKARQALVRQLQSYDPPLSPGDITTQRLQLEESIRRVEAEVAGAAFGLGAQEHAPPTPAPPPRAAPAAATPAAAEPVRAEAAAEKPAQDKPAAAVADKPAAAPEAAPAAARPAPEKAPAPKPEPPAAAKPAPAKPDANQPASEKAAAEKPAAPAPAKPAADKPAPAVAAPGPQAAGETTPKPAAKKVEPAPVRAEPAGKKAEPAKPAGPAPQKVAPKPQANQPAAEAPAAGEPRIGAGVDALAKTLRQAEALGGASANAVRHARDAIEDTELEPRLPVAEPDKIEPGFAGAEPRRPVVPPPPLEAPIEPPVRRRRPLDEAPADAAEPMSAPDGDRRKRMVIAAVVALLLVAGGAAAYAISQVGIGPLLGERDTRSGADVAAVQPSDQGGEALEPKIPDRLPQNGEPMPAAPDAKAVATERVTAVEAEPGTPPPPAAPAEPASPPAATAPTTDVAATEPVQTPPAATAPAATPPPAEPATPTTTEPVATEPVAPPPADTAGTPPPGVDVPPPAFAPPEGTTTTTEPVTPAAPAPTGTDTAAPAPTTTTPAPAANQPVVLVAQRAILYEEPIPGSDGARVEGQVLWTLVDEPVLPGEAPVPQIRATVEVPDRKIKLVLSIRRNTDQALPASHIAEMRFDLPSDFPGRGIDTTPGLILKQTEDARGDPLIGAVAKVSDNLFWLALSGADQDAVRNVALLKEREWIDVPIRYLNRRRAILTFEKGTPGGEVFQRALAAWGL